MRNFTSMRHCHVYWGLSKGAILSALVPLDFVGVPLLSFWGVIGGGLLEARTYKTLETVSATSNPQRPQPAEWPRHRSSPAIPLSEAWEFRAWPLEGGRGQVTMHSLGGGLDPTKAASRSGGRGCSRPPRGYIEVHGRESQPPEATFRAGGRGS
eukprot:1196302-Prorocentrum_minimum.AAC.3